MGGHITGTAYSRSQRRTPDHLIQYTRTKYRAAGQANHSKLARTPTTYSYRLELAFNASTLVLVRREAEDADMQWET